MHFDILITRHQGLVDFLLEQGHEFGLVISHVTAPAVLDGKDVIGVLPVHLAARCETFSELTLEIPAELRGVDLSRDQVAEFQRGIRTYKITEA